MSVATDATGRSAIGLRSAWIESQRTYSGVPRLSIGVVHDQELVWSAGFGRASVEPARAATPDTLYRIASITKLCTSTAILQLRDAGKLRLDDPLVEHLPWFRIKPSGADASAIIIRHTCSRTRRACRARPASRTGPTASSRRRTRSASGWPSSRRRCRWRSGDFPRKEARCSRSRRPRTCCSTWDVSWAPRRG